MSSKVWTNKDLRPTSVLRRITSQLHVWGATPSPKENSGNIIVIGDLAGTVIRHQNHVVRGRKVREYMGVLKIPRRAPRNEVQKTCRKWPYGSTHDSNTLNLLVGHEGVWLLGFNRLCQPKPVVVLSFPKSNRKIVQAGTTSRKDKTRRPLKKTSQMLRGRKPHIKR